LGLWPIGRIGAGGVDHHHLALDRPPLKLIVLIFQPGSK
jgi:hypothetical protein